MFSISSDDEPLRVRRQLVDVVAAIVGRDRLDPVGIVLGEVALVEQAVALLHVGGDRLGDRSLVERIASALGDLLERRARGSGFAKISPGCGAWPLGRNVAAATGSRASLRLAAFHWPPMISGPR